VRRLLTRWLALLAFVAIMSGIFVRLGLWQWHRLEQRRATNAQIIANRAQPVKDFTQVFGKQITDLDQWQRVHARGEFDAEHQFQVRYRSNAGETGWEAVTPLVTEDGTTVLINRGFVARPKGQPFPEAVPAPPSGTVSVVGYVRRSERGKDTATVPHEGKVRLINAPAISASLGRPVLDGYIMAVTIEPEQEGEFKAIALPELSDGPHFWYALQWWSFTGMALAGLVVFIRRDVRELRRAPAQADEEEPDGSRAD